MHDYFRYFTNIARIAKINSFMVDINTTNWNIMWSMVRRPPFIGTHGECQIFHIKVFGKFRSLYIRNIPWPEQKMQLKAPPSFVFIYSKGMFNKTAMSYGMYYFQPTRSCPGWMENYQNRMHRKAWFLPNGPQFDLFQKYSELLLQQVSCYYLYHKFNPVESHI